MSYRSWTFVAVVSAAFAGSFCGSILLQSQSALAQQQPPAPSVLTASTIQIVDSAGKPRMTVGMMGEKVGMVVLSPEGTPRVLAGLDGDDAGLILNFADGEPGMYVGAKEKGCGMTFRDTQRKDRITMGVDPESAGFQMNYADGSEAYSLGATATDGGFGINYPGDKKICWSVGTGPKGSGLSMRKPDGKEVFGIGMPPDYGPRLFFRDENGIETFSAP